MNKKTRKEVVEWVVLIAVLGALYFTGWYRPLLSTMQGALLESGLFRPSQIDSPVQADYNFRLQDDEGHIIPAATLKGQTVFINFWATWCPPCRAEMPDIHDLFKKTGKEVTFLMVSMDDNAQTAQNYLRQQGYTFPHYRLASSLPAMYQVSSIPTTYVISPEGQIVVEAHGMNQYDTEAFSAFLRGLSKR